MTQEEIIKQKRSITKRLNEVPVNSTKYKKLMKQLALLKFNAGELKFKQNLLQ